MAVSSPGSETIAGGTKAMFIFGGGGMSYEAFVNE